MNSKCKEVVLPKGDNLVLIQYDTKYCLDAWPF
jgi:hypothetical protein